MPSVVFIGAGNLATSLALALHKAGLRLLQVYSRSEESAVQLAQLVNADYTNDVSGVIPEADIYIYALRDEVYASHFMLPQTQSDSVHLVTSGSVPYTMLCGKTHRGVFYPFQTFSKQKPIDDFSRIPVMTEAEDSQAVQAITLLAESLHCPAHDSTSESRMRLHVAGVFANNFTNCMYAIAEEQLLKAGLPFDLLLPLIDETALKVHNMPPRKAQTGPAARHDEAIIEKHISLLDDDNLKHIYRLITDNIEGNS